MLNDTWIHEVLEADRSEPPKQRHTAQRIFDRLRTEQDYTGGVSIVKDAVRVAERGSPPLAQAQRFQLFRPTTLRLAPGDLFRITQNGFTADGNHRLAMARLIDSTASTTGGILYWRTVGRSAKSGDIWSTVIA